MRPGVDLQRQEERFFLVEHCRGSLQSLLERFGFKSRLFPNQFVQTVYLLDDRQFWSMGASFKARRYTPHWSGSISLDDIREETFGFQIKQDCGTEEGWKVKTPRANVTLPGAVAAAESFARPSDGLRPFFVTEYQREHYTRGDSFQVTVDLGTHFWYFPFGRVEAVPIGGIEEERIIRIELKFDPIGEADVVSRFRIELKDLGALPIISKKQQALNLLKMWLDLQFAAKRMVKEIRGTEIESKLSVSGDPDALFDQLIRQDFGDFQHDPNYPFVVTTGSTNHYWGKRVNGRMMEGAKALFRGSVVNFVLKSGREILDPELGILARREEKLPRLTYSGGSLENLAHEQTGDLTLKYVGFLHRTRKALWLKNRCGGRIYHLSLDRCYAKDKTPLVQAEVEYAGCVGDPLSSGDTRHVIVEDTRSIARMMIRFFAHRTKASMLALGQEKFDWLIR